MQTPPQRVPEGPPIFAESSATPRGCGCFIFIAVVVAAAVFFGPMIVEHVRELRRTIEREIAPPPAARGALPVRRTCAIADRAHRTGRVIRGIHVPNELDELLHETPPDPNFIQEERLVAEVQPAQWAAGMGDPQGWAEVFSRNGFQRGLQYFWSTPDGDLMMSHQVLAFDDAKKARRFHAYYNTAACRLSDRADRVPSIPGAVYFLRADPNGWSNEIVFSRGPIFVYVGVLAEGRVVRDPRVSDLARRAEALIPTRR